jgi:hypothetical protein
MVVVVAVQAVHVHGDAGAYGETGQAVRDHFAAEVADFFAAQVELADTVWAVREVDDGAREGFV